MSSFEKNVSGTGAASRLSRLMDDSFLFENMPVGLYVCDAHGTIIRYNRAAAELWGRKHGAENPAMRFCGSYRLLDPDDRVMPHAEGPMSVALSTRRGCRNQRIRIERPEGQRAEAFVSIEILKDQEGRMIGAAGILRAEMQDGHAAAGRDREMNRLWQVLQSLPAAIYMTDAAGKITFYNDAATEMWGLRPKIGSSEFCGSWKLYRPDGTRLPHDKCPMAVALKERRAINGQEAAAERPDGTRIPFLAYPTPLFDAAGDLAGAVNLLVDIGPRKTAELASHRLVAIVSSSDDAILSKDITGIITSWNRGAEYLFGYTEDEAIGKSVAMLIPEDRQDEEPEILARIRRGEHIEHYETVRQKKDGTLVDISLSVSPVMDSNGMIIGASKIARDISDRRRAEEQKDLMLGEMNHRVKNLFALADGLLGLTARDAGSVPDLVTRLRGKFLALARAHSLTMTPMIESRSEEVATLHALVVEVTKPYFDDEEADRRIFVTGPDIALGQRAVTNIALIFHEFATNAFKYGALSDPAGQVRVECAEAADDICITWRESGVASGTGEPQQEGFGSRLTRTAISALGGDFSREYTRDGLEIRLILPRARILA